MTPIAETEMHEAETTVGARLKAARVALVLLPLFFVAVLALAITGQNKRAAVAAENNRPAFERELPALDPEVEASVRASLPEDASEEERTQAVERVQKALAPQEGGPRGQRGGGSGEQGGGEQGGGGPLGPLMGLFTLMFTLSAVFGIWTLLSARAPRLARAATLVALPLTVLLGLATTGFAWVAISEEPEERRRPFNTLAVMAGEAEQQDVELSISTQGEVRPRTEIDLVPEVGGKIVSISPNFVQGGIFRRGETLVRVDPSDYEVAVVSAEANVANARQALAREVAEARLAESDIRELGIEDASDLALRRPQLQQAEAAVRAAESELERARLQLQRTSVRAPFAGRVREKSADVGQFVSPGARLGRIFSTDIVEVRLPLTDADLAKIDLPLAYVAESRDTAPRVTLSAEIAGERREWDGRIMRTDASYDTQTRALFAIVEVADPYGAGGSGGAGGVPLAPGLFVDAEVRGRALEDMVVIPRDALRPRDEVYVVDGEGKADIRSVSVVDSDADRAVLRPGPIAPGELVVVSPMERSRVEIPLQVMDMNDPKTVLVEPPRPAWMGPADDDDDGEEESADSGTAEG